MNKIVAALLSLLVAFGLWLYVITVVAPESDQVYYDVPIRLQGSALLESRGLMLVSDQNLKLDLELHGARTDLNKLSNSNITVIADLSTITTAGEHTLHYSVSYPGSISSGITVVSPEQQTITVSVMEWAKKEVPIVVEYIGQLPENYTVDGQNVVLERNSVVISGVKQEVDRIENAVITIDLEGKTENIDQTFDIWFADENGQAVELENVTAEAQTVTAVVKIKLTKTVDIVLQVIPGGGMTEEDVTCEPWFDELTVSGSAAALEGFDSIVLDVDIGSLQNSGTILLDIELPEGVTNESGVMQVAVEVTLPSVVQKTFTDLRITPENCINVPENMEVTITDYLIYSVVTVEGRAHLVDQITDENIRLTIDLAGAEPGTYAVFATVELVGLDDVSGLKLDYRVQVRVTLTQIETEEEPEG